MTTVKPEVIEPGNKIQVSYQPAIIDDNIEQVRDWINQELEIYRDTTIDIHDLNQVKEARRSMADLNKLYKRVDDERKRIKRVYNEPLAAFEARVKPIEEDIRWTRESIKAQVDEAGEAFKETRRAFLEDTYTGWLHDQGADALHDLLPLDTLVTSEMMRQSVSDFEAAQKLMERAGEMYAKYKQLDSLTLNHKDEVLARFCETGEMTDALSEEERLNSEDAKMTAFKERKEAVISATRAVKSDSNDSKDTTVYRWQLTAEFTGDYDRMHQVAEAMKACDLSGHIKRLEK